MTITTADKLKEATMTLDPKALEAALPCPFCGATPHYNVGKVRTCQLHGDPIQDHVYVCPHGCARKSGPTKRRALDTWNTRTRAAALPPVDVAGLVNWSCDERNRDKCRNAHGCHCKEIANLATALERVARENALLEVSRKEAVKTIAELERRAEAAQARIAALEGALFDSVKAAHLRGQYWQAENPEASHWMREKAAYDYADKTSAVALASAPKGGDHGDVEYLLGMLRAIASGKLDAGDAKAAALTALDLYGKGPRACAAERGDAPPPPEKGGE